MVNMEATYMTHSGDDSLVVNAARASFSKETTFLDIDAALLSQPEITEENRHKVQLHTDYIVKLAAERVLNALSYADHRLVNFLAEEKHLLPFRHPHITLRCKAPLFLSRQLGKHQVGMTWSEESRRYIDSEPEFWWPNKWRKRAEDKKQGSTDEEITEIGPWASFDDPLAQRAVPMTSVQRVVTNTSLTLYKNMLKFGVAPELARMILPQNMMVNWVWTGSLLAWFHLYDQRAGHGAQVEATEFAEKIKAQIAPLYPAAWAALEKNCRNFKIEEVK